jgi:mannose-6-phosphate isomerase-like protein (cupin superfamily)
VSRKGEVFTNPVTGERAVVREGSEDGDDPSRAVVDLYVEPGGAVAAQHVHDTVWEGFKVVSGTVGFRLNGEESILGPGEGAEAPIGTPHDWWNAGGEVAHVEVELKGDGERFEQMLVTLFGLAHEGKVNDKGRPGLLQLAVIARDFRDVIRFTKPPAWVQAALFGPLAALGRARGLRATYPHHRDLVVSTEVRTPAG